MMKHGTNPKRSRGRGNGRRPFTNTRTQVFDSSGPEVRIRGNAYQVHEKYLALARDATSAGDRIAAENYYQHAEHYYRILTSRSEEERPFAPRGARPDGTGEDAVAGADPVDAGSASA